MGEKLKALWKKYREQWSENKWTVVKLTLIYAVLILINETIFRKSGFKAMEWITKDFGLFLMNIATIFAILSLFLMVFRRVLGITVITTNLLLLLGLINTGKYALRNIPLDLEDAFLVKEVVALAPQLVNKQAIFGLVGLIGVMLLSTWLLYKILGWKKLENHHSVFTTTFVVSILILLVGQTAFSGNLDVMKTGFIYNLSSRTRMVPAFNAELIKGVDDIIKEDIKSYVSPYKAQNMDKKPNVIVIQSEAFWDINKLKLDISENPIANFEALRAESTFGEMYVPVIGGGTSNTEYEILSGMTLKNYTSDWYMVYPNELDEPLITLASIFKAHGYESLALHPYMSWYYDRMTVYKNMGFDTFKSIEYMESPEIIGAYTSDRYITDEIIKSIESTEAPLFNFTVTMQNHGPYGNYRFDEDQMTVKLNDNLSNDSNYFLKNYIQGLYYTDIELKRLIDYLRASDEPTVVLFYGDHLPMLGDDYLAYRESGYVGNETSAVLQQDLKMMAVPYVLWSNYDQTSTNWDVMNASFMPARLLEKIGLDMPNYFKELAIMSREMPVILRTYGIDSEGNKLTVQNETYQMIMAKYHLLNKNLKTTLYDEHYDVWLDEKNLMYNTALNDINIETAEIYEQKTIIRGRNFYETMTVYINDSAAEFEFVTPDEVILKSAVKVSDDVRMELKTDQGDLITQSNIFKVQQNN